MNLKVHCAYTDILSIDLLKPNPRNPNTHPQIQVELLAKIIREQGWRAPITVSEQSGYIVRGHCRYLAAKLLGEQQVPVDKQSYDTPEQEMADLIADNRIAELAEIDDELMIDLLGELGQSEIDMELTGFESEMMNEYFSSFENEQIPDFQPSSESEQPTLDEKKKITCPNCGHEF